MYTKSILKGFAEKEVKPDEKEAFLQAINNISYITTDNGTEICMAGELKQAFKIAGISAQTSRNLASNFMDYMTEKDTI